MPADTEQGNIARREVDQLDRRFGAMARRLAGSHPAWQQELVISAYNDARLAFVRSEMWAEGERHGGGAEGLLPFTVEAARARSDAGFKPSIFRRIRLRAQVLAARLGALLAFLLLLLRSLKWPRLERQHSRTVLALHAEKANRTGHVRKALKACDPDSIDVMFVGRVHLDRDGAEAMLREAGWDGEFSLAWDWRSALASLPDGLRIAREGWRAMEAASFFPGFKQLLAINLRILIGAASAWRWRACEGKAEALVLGHTGRADVTLLEQAAQQGGTRTVHWMHGLSDGYTYQGLSDLCVTLCEHDKCWHDNALNYRRNVCFPSPVAPFRMGTAREWMVLTNLTHFAYPPFSEVGSAHELRLIERVADLAREDGMSPADVIWKPHPVFYQSDPETRAVVTAALEREGFQLWPEPATDFERAGHCELLIATTSGIATDLVVRGRLPLVVGFYEQEPNHVLAQLHASRAEPEAMREALAMVRDPQRAREEFDRIVSKVGPARQPTLAEIESSLLGA